MAYSPNTIVATIAALIAATTATLPASPIYVLGYRTPGDGGEGFFRIGTSATANGGTIVNDASSRSWYRQTNGAPYSLAQFGAYGDGTHDDTAAINAAVATGHAVIGQEATYLISAPLVFTTSGQPFRGQGRSKTFFKLAATFTSGAAAFNVSTLASGDTGPEFHDFCIYAVQPDTSTRASLIAYPPLIYLNASPRTKIRDVRLCGGINGVAMTGNCGGSDFTRVESGNFGYNWSVDGNLDVTNWTDCEVWPFAQSPGGIMTANQQAIFADSNCYGIYSLRNDYLDWKGGLILCGRSAVFGTGSDGTTYGAFTGTGFDTFGGPEVSAGEIQCVGCTFSVGGVLGTAVNNSKNAALHTGGILSIIGGNVFLGTGTLGNNSVFYSSSTGGGFNIDGVEIALGTLDPVTAITIAAGATPIVKITRNGLNRIGSGAYTVPILNIQGGTGVISGNTCFANVSASGNTNWLTIGAGLVYTETGNNNYNWSTSIAGSTVASAGTVMIPPVFTDAVQIINVTGTTTINFLTYTTVGVTAPFAGQIVTLLFASALTVTSGTIGVAGSLVLNNRSNFSAAAGSSLTLTLDNNGNWREAGRVT